MCLSQLAFSPVPVDNYGVWIAPAPIFPNSGDAKKDAPLAGAKWNHYVLGSRDLTFPRTWRTMALGRARPRARGGRVPPRSLRARRHPGAGDPTRCVLGKRCAGFGST